jgi:hypothetical protein
MAPQASSSTVSTDDSTTADKIPFLVGFWGSLSNGLPQLSIGGLNFSVTVFSALFLIAVRLTAEYVLISYFGWPAGSLLTKDAASSVGSIVHSMNLVPGLWQCFMSQPYVPSEKMATAPIWWQDGASALLQLTTGYMVYDAVFNIFWVKRATGVPTDDYIFIAHHVVTILYMTSTRIIGAGHQSAMMCMFLGEVTNPLHNAYFIGEKAMQLECCNGPMAQQLFRIIQIAFSIFYLAVRGPIAPSFFAPMTWDLWARGRKHIPIWIIFIWSLLIWGVLFGSIPWTIECWDVLKKFAGEAVLIAVDAADKEL